MTKEDIRRLLHEKKGDRAETRVAKQITLLGFCCMILGVVYWVFNYFSRIPNDLLLIFLGIFIGSCLTGLTIFFFSMGEYLYYQFHEPYLRRHWLYLGVMRTFFQVFFFGSFIIIFILCWRLYNHIDMVFFLVFFLLSLPAYIGTLCSRLDKVRNLFEDLASNGSLASTEATTKT